MQACKALVAIQPPNLALTYSIRAHGFHLRDNFIATTSNSIVWILRVVYDIDASDNSSRAVLWQVVGCDVISVILLSPDPEWGLTHQHCMAHIPVGALTHHLKGHGQMDWC